jgi:hypothetical protein
MPNYNKPSGHVNYAPPGYGNYEYFNKTYVEWYDTRRNIRRFSRRQKSDGFVDLIDIADMIDILMEQHQMSFIKDAGYGFKLFFPHMFIKPVVGDKVQNMTTGEVYTIEWVETIAPNFRRPPAGPYVKRPKIDVFTGLVILSGITEPKVTDRLEYIDNKNDKLINFFEWGTRTHSKTPSGPGEGDLGQGERGPFPPTITWSINRVEPGTVGKRPFDPAKMSKPMFREVYPDPDYTYLTQSDTYNYSVKQQSIYPTGDPMFTGSYSALNEASKDPRNVTHNIEVYGQWFDNLVQFDCWSNSNNEANALISWFEDFMELYTPVLKQNGVAEALYWERLQDQTIERWRNDIENRTIRWFFRTEKLRIRKSRNFRKFNMRLSVGLPNEYSANMDEPSGINTWAGQYGYQPHEVSHDTGTGIHYTGDGSYLWGQITIED